MSFSVGQLIFAALFLILFIVILASAYRKDKRYIKFHYRGSYKILIFIIAAFAILWLMVRFL